MPHFSQDTEIKIGNGRKDSFWQNNGLGHSPFRNVFLTLFNLSQETNFTLVQSREADFGAFRRNPNEWEIRVIAEIMIKGCKTYAPVNMMILWTITLHVWKMSIFWD